jgi:hypothetical protein
MRWRIENCSPVGILILVHEDVIEPFVQESDERLVAKEMKPVEEEIVIIEHMPFLLCFVYDLKSSRSSRSHSMHHGKNAASV